MPAYRSKQTTLDEARDASMSAIMYEAQWLTMACARGVKSSGHCSASPSNPIWCYKHILRSLIARPTSGASS